MKTKSSTATTVIPSPGATTPKAWRFAAEKKHEHDQLSDRFKAIIRNRWRCIARQSVCLSGFNDMFTNGIKLFPIICKLRDCLLDKSKIGDIQQTVQAFATANTPSSSDVLQQIHRLPRLDGASVTAFAKYGRKNNTMTPTLPGSFSDGLDLVRKRCSIPPQRRSFIRRHQYQPQNGSTPC